MTYVSINGHSTWVDDRGGDGPAVLLLHGALSSSDRMFELFGEPLADFRLIAFDRAGHGRTADRPGPWSYGAMADGAIGVLEALDVQRCQVVGVSDGAVVALHLALARPDLITALVLESGVFHHSRRVASGRPRTTRTGCAARRPVPARPVPAEHPDAPPSRSARGRPLTTRMTVLSATGDLWLIDDHVDVLRLDVASGVVRRERPDKSAGGRVQRRLPVTSRS